MRIAFIADWRSPTARGWITAAAGLGHQCRVLATHPLPLNLEPPPLGVSVLENPIAASNLRQRLITSHGAANRIVGGTSIGTLARIRRAVAPYDLQRHVRSTDRMIDEFDADVVHALRIPYAGMLAARLRSPRPLLVSVWGNDFTLHAAATTKIDHLTRAAVARADILIADSQHDLDLAQGFGLEAGKRTELAPGGGGIDLEAFGRLPSRREARGRFRLPPDVPVVINPRGPREYVRNAEYCEALAIVAQAAPEARFVFADMAVDRPVRDQLNRLGLLARTLLLPRIPQADMAVLFRAADVAVSPATHDGTPNTLLEAMAAGCLPVAGDIPSVREWIIHGENGLLCEATAPESIAAAILRSLDDAGLAERARIKNLTLITERAELRAVLPRIEDLYASALQAIG